MAAPVPVPVSARVVRLRITGFKSFAEPATIDILPGLTGIVGPNGCGKSNVAEALRWAMGESNARTLRGGEMDDVIFAGTATRPGRNLAEVALTLEGALPPPFAAEPELHVVRRIERGTGSGYHVNGREARARDVQTLFADLGSGARSSAMISQGRVAAIVGARPEERRSVLEEAAGITGLHGRRAEAEGKLRAAEANLERAGDQRGHLDGQLASLQRQADEAQRYSALSADAMAAEAALLALALGRADAAQAQAARALAAAKDKVTQHSALATQSAAEGTRTAAALPGLREDDGAARLALEVARATAATAAANAERARDALDSATARQAQINRDLHHAEAVLRDAAGAEERLAAEADRLLAGAALSPGRIAAARAEAAAAAEYLDQAERASQDAVERAAASNAGAAAVAALVMAAKARARRATDTLARLGDERARAALRMVDPARAAAAAAVRDDATAKLGEAQRALDTAEAARAAAAPGAAAAREAANRTEAARSRLAAEAGALGEIVGVREHERWPPLLDQVQVLPGLEAALGAALGEDLAAAADPLAARHWRILPALTAPPLPGEALAGLVHGPAALVRALGAIGVVADDAAGDAGQPGLQPGQSLVSRAGAVWRWDGYTVRAGTPSAAAVRLQQRNRLASLRDALAQAATAAETARQARITAETVERNAVAAEAQARPARRDAEARLDHGRRDAAALHAQAAAAASAIAALDAQIGPLQPEAAEAASALAAAEAQHAALPDMAALRAAADSARANLMATRQRDAAASRTAEAALREDAGQAARGRTLVREREDWRMRAHDARDRVLDLRARAAEASVAHARLSNPDAGARQAAAAAEREASLRQRTASDALVAAERSASIAANSAAQSLATLAASREALARADAAVEAADAAMAAMRARVLDRLGVHGALPPAPPDVSAAAEDKARARMERLVRERDGMGPVNLRAAFEARGVAALIAATMRDQDELQTAIAKLRGSIGHLNREGRERLSAVFQQVDRHFQALFSRMFGGGRAHLAMVGSDDPLAAGLEIYAQPPGKKLSALSLLSGGEQALTALSLVFAVFRCHPAPVCVLDEVDAPLDDANVDRFCTLLADMVGETGTRFLVVTHHQLTMARMDRLYGVTMAERGVSRLLSVDLGAAVSMIEVGAAAQAAE